MAIYELDGVAPELPEAGSYWIAPCANIIGRVRLARDVGVWFGCTVRGDNELIDVGEGSNLQECALLHTDMGFPLTIGRHCTIGHGAILHGCTIGDECLVGMGATILNGARLGRGCLVGANALVPEGRDFPDGSLIVGAPAKAVRQLDPAALDRMKAGAGNYVRNWKRYAAGLTRLD